jgi:hypothetical protein
MMTPNNLNSGNKYKYSLLHAWLPRAFKKMRGLRVWLANKSLCLRARHETEFQGFGQVRGKEAPADFLAA